MNGKTSVLGLMSLIGVVGFTPFDLISGNGA